MDQRRLKVGDIVDDYCPRERRVTDHAIVAMIDETIRQTRCTACDNEHPYKEARMPRPRRKTTPAALYQEVLTNVTEGTAPAPQPVVVPPPAAVRPAADIVADPPAVTENAAAPADEAQPPKADEGPVHRPLIRATLPRPQGDAPTARPIPEFTVRQSGGRGRFRDEFRGGFRNAGGRNGAGHQGQGRPGRPGGGSGGQQSRGRHHGRPSPHKKRSR